MSGTALKRFVTLLLHKYAISHQVQICLLKIFITCIFTTSSLTQKFKLDPIFLPVMHIIIAFPFIIILLLAGYRMTRKYFSRWSPSQLCLVCLKKARVKDYGGFVSQNVILPETTNYGTIDQSVNQTVMIHALLQQVYYINGCAAIIVK